MNEVDRGGTLAGPVVKLSVHPHEVGHICDVDAHLPSGSALAVTVLDAFDMERVVKVTSR